MLAPIIIAVAWNKVIKPALTKPTIIIVEAPDDWMIAVTAAPIPIPTQRFLLVLLNNFFTVDERAELFGKYIVENNATVRDTAAYYGISKSTVHKDVTERLKRKNPSLCEEVGEVLLKNKSERHLRGGNATRLRYQKLKGENQQKIIKTKRDLC